MCQLATDSGSNNPGELSPATRALVPYHPAAEAALKLAVSTLPPSILYHSFRVYLYAKAFTSPPIPSETTDATSPLESISVEPHVLFVACMLHDIATVEKYDGNPLRFEVTGADEAAFLLRQHGVDEGSVREAWLAMSLHTSPGIAERIPGAVATLRQAIRAEFGGRDAPLARLGEHERNAICDEFPRLDIERDLGDSVVRQALKTRSKAPSASWPGIMLRAKEQNPDWDGVNKSFWG